MHPNYKFDFDGDGSGRLGSTRFLFSVASSLLIGLMISLHHPTFIQEYIPVHKHWRLNERSYGDLVGLNKKEVVKIFGKDQVKRWRRSYDEPPPPMNDDHEHHPKRDPRYRLVRTFRIQSVICASLTFCVCVSHLSSF